MTRLAGDEFAVLLEAADESRTINLAERVLSSFYRDFIVQGHSLRATRA